MPDFTTTLSEVQKKALEYIATDINEWINNAAQNRARKAKEEIIALNMAHCNANSIAIATGEDAQVDQAYSLGVVKTAVARNAEAAEDSKE